MVTVAKLARVNAPNNAGKHRLLKREIEVDVMLI